MCRNTALRTYAHVRDTGDFRCQVSGFRAWTPSDPTPSVTCTTPPLLGAWSTAAICYGCCQLCRVDQALTHRAQRLIELATCLSVSSGDCRHRAACSAQGQRVSGPCMPSHQAVSQEFPCFCSHLRIFGHFLPQPLAHSICVTLPL